MQSFLAVGEEVAGYRIESFIGRGGMAVVYRAQDLRLGRQVALKLLAPELSENERFRQRFIRESQLAAAIDHPNIIPIYEAGNTPDLLYIVMRYVDGVDLKALLERERRLQPERALNLFLQVAAALDAAHARGLVHRDVKPGNIIVASGHGGEDVDHVYLTDFGLTKKSLSLSDFTTVGHFVGTVDYVAPEQIASKPIDGRADIYGLGCVMYEALAGVLPFERDDDAATLWAHMLEPVPPLTVHRPDLPSGVDAVFARALAKAPEDRYPTCRALVAALRTELAGWHAAETSISQLPMVPPQTSSSPSGPFSVPPEAPYPSPSYGASPPSGYPAPGYRPPAHTGSSAMSSPPGVELGVPVGSAEPDQEARALERREWRRQWRFGRRGIALVAALVTIVALAGVLLLRAGRNDMTAYDGSFAAAPFTLQHPTAWPAEAHSSFFVVFSRNDMTELFGGSGWEQASRLLRSDPGGVVGVYAKVTYQGFDIGDMESLQQQVSGDLGAVGKVDFTGAQTSIVVDQRPGVRLDGLLSDPGGSSSLRFHYYVIPVDPRQQAVAHLMFFGAPSVFADEQPVFRRVLDTVDLEPVAGG